MGTSAPGEIAALCALGRPTLGVITAIGPAHLEGLGTIEGVLEEKLALARALPPGATLFVNGDDPRLREAAYPAGLEVIRLGLETCDGVLSPPPGARSGVLRLRPEGIAIRHPFTSTVLMRNLWIALHVAHRLGVSEEALAAAAPGLGPAKLRGETRRVGAAEIVVDCYNANPLSMTAALADLARRAGRRAAVLGDMLELGGESPRWHRELGRALAGSGLHHVVFIGTQAGEVAAGAWDGGMDPRSIETFADLDRARPAFRVLVARGGTILLKASRGMALERLLEGIDA